MRNLFKFLKRFRNFSIFVVLQFFILGLFFNSKNYHRATYVNTTSAVSGWLLKKRYNIAKHFNLESANEDLAEANADLLEQLPQSFYPLQHQLYKVNDTVNQLQYEYFPATVIKYTNHKRNNYATINKGSLSGVKPGMGVMTEKGIVGFVIDVSKHYSIIRTILSEQINLTVEINEVMGVLEWKGYNNAICNVKGITTSSQIAVGDLVTVKGSNGHFPRGISVGEVIEVVDENGSATLKIEVKLSTNFKALSHVYLVNNNFKPEQKSLEEDYYE